jgi:iron complex transport system substrate-binding protein
MEIPPSAPRRIVSLLPAATEIAAALGLTERLVGRSHECDEPAGVERLPALTAARIDASVPSREIHEQVGRALAGGPAACGLSPTEGSGTPSTGTPPTDTTAAGGGSAALFALDVDTIARLAPDLILTQAACDVCAIAAADVEAAVRRAGVGTRVLSLSPTTLADLFSDIFAVGAATGTLPRAREVVARLQARIDSVTCRVRALGRQAAAKPPRVAMIEWLDPPMAAGNWVPEMVHLASGEDALGRPGEHSHWITWDDVAAADPDVVVLVPCGFPLDRVLAEAESPAVRPQLERLRAFHAGRVVAVDGHHLFNRPGPRLVDSLEVLAQILHPAAFRFGHGRHVAAIRG